MFVGQEVLLDVSFPIARAGLLDLTRGGWLSRASDGAYAEGLTALVRVGPFGEVLGASKLVRVLLLDPVERGDKLVLSLRWEATGVLGSMFPVLDANITLTPAGQDRARIDLAGAYRPPLSTVGEGLDRVLLHRAADATVRSLLRRIARTIAPATAGTVDGEPGLAAAFPPEPESAQTCAADAAADPGRQDSG